MKSVKVLSSIAIMASVAVFSSCKKDEVKPTPTPTPATSKDLTLNFTGLENLGNDFVYEGWIMVNGTPKTTGRFTVDDSGVASMTTFNLPIADVDAATAYILTIEPAVDADPAPSAVHILAGTFAGNSATLAIDHAAALGNSFASAAGGYILASPTDGGNMTDENSGVWFLNPTGTSPTAGLDLPTLPAGWNYEGWAVIDGTPVSTGTFTSVSGADNAAPYSGSTAGPAFPGEDLLMNAPAGLTFPTDLAGKTIVVSIEPSPDNSPAPFTLKPLAAMVDMSAADHTWYELNNNIANTAITGTATR